VERTEKSTTGKSQCKKLILETKMPFSANYDIGMDTSANPGASQWCKLNVNVGDNGSILIHDTLDNDQVFGWSGQYRFDFKEKTGPNTDQTLFSVTSPVYKQGPKPPGQHIMQPAPDLNLMVDAGLAQRFIAKPSMYGVRIQYSRDPIPFLPQIEAIGQAVLTVVGAVAGA
jgi:hypothetical protein